MQVARRERQDKTGRETGKMSNLVESKLKCFFLNAKRNLTFRTVDQSDSHVKHLIIDYTEDGDNGEQVFGVNNFDNKSEWYARLSYFLERRDPQAE